MDTLRILVNQQEVYFLLLSRTEQELLVDKMLQRMVSGATLGCRGDMLLGRNAYILQEMYTGVFTQEEFRSLGIMAPFVVDEVFIQLDRSFFTQNLHYLRGLCYKGTKMDIVARVLQEPTVFG